MSKESVTPWNVNNNGATQDNPITWVALQLHFSSCWRMVQFAEVLPDLEIVATLSRQLIRSHFVELIPLADGLERDFYAELCRVERWSVRTLRHKSGRLLYLRWLEQHDVRQGEAPPLGLILCADKSEEHNKLLRLNDSGIRVAQYLTELPPRELLERKLHDSIRLARERLARTENHRRNIGHSETFDK